MNPRKLKPFIEADSIRFKKRMTECESISYMQGQYNRLAIISCLPKGSKYPDKPIKIFDFDKKSDVVLTEEEIQKERENLFSKLQLMQINFELNKNKERVP